ncbi:ATP-binding protein [Paenibacillus aurantius]|uniref:histidine kinase n=1 Tax=Paenibacillus aurantius TaxID=2918900 RepID=A0AA96LH13_9BACL|nr:ATP-binding protein [Paenibacillus aurantius]WNQ13133.1 ATP-binding protein [Paenibacillus aurantius]
MNELRRFLRKMNVQLFLAFLMVSVLFLILVTNVTSFNLQQMLNGFVGRDLERTGYLLLDDMREHGIRDKPLTSDQRDWLQRRAALYGVLMEFRNKDRSVVWFQTIQRIGQTAVIEKELPYLYDGMTLGYLRLADREQSTSLNPAIQGYQESLVWRTKLLYSLLFLVAVVVSYLIAKRLSRHLNRVYRMAEEIGSGNRSIRIPLEGPEEVRRLTATLNNMSAELKRQEDWRHQLMEDFMHELRTPLTSVLPRVEAMVDGLLKPDPAQMQEIYEELERFTRLVNDLERLSEAEAARFAMIIKRTNMVKLTLQIYNQHKALAKEKGIKLKLEATNVPCYAEIDRDKIVQVMTNVVLNAIKYTPPGGRVTLMTDWTEDHILLACEDTGIGISTQDLPYIFNRLYRADKSRSRFSGGVGLGLSIAKALVEAHNGELTASSQVGKGSRFMIKLPNRYQAYSKEEGA